MNWSGWWWHLLLAPIYLLLSTARHEGLHAFAAWTYGARILLFKVTPHWHLGRLYFGRVVWKGNLDDEQHGLVLALPYIANTMLLFCWFMLWQYFRLESNIHVFAAVTSTMLISPAVDTLYGLFNGYVRDRGDFAKLREIYRK